jgi:hypothetical protein
MKKIICKSKLILQSRDGKMQKIEEDFNEENKKPYQKPEISSEKIFESQSLACLKCDVLGGPTVSCGTPSAS